MVFGQAPGLSRHRLLGTRPGGRGLLTGERLGVLPGHGAASFPVLCAGKERGTWLLPQMAEALVPVDVIKVGRRSDWRFRTMAVKQLLTIIF